jgi:hypothetical protein
MGEVIMPIQDCKICDDATGEKVWCNGEFAVWMYPDGDQGGDVFRLGGFGIQFGWRFRSVASAVRAIPAVLSIQQDVPTTDQVG